MSSLHCSVETEKKTPRNHGRWLLTYHAKTRRRKQWWQTQTRKKQRWTRSECCSAFADTGMCVCANWKDFGNATTSLLKSILCCVSLLYLNVAPRLLAMHRNKSTIICAIHASRTKVFSNTFHWSQYAILSGPCSGSVWKPTHAFAIHHLVIPHADIAALILPTLNPDLSQTTTTSLLIHPNMPPPRPNAHYSSLRAQTNMMLEMYCKLECAYYRSVCLNENILFCIIFRHRFQPTHHEVEDPRPLYLMEYALQEPIHFSKKIEYQTHRVVMTTDVGMSVLCQLATKLCKRLIPLKNMQRYIKNTKTDEHHFCSKHCRWTSCGEQPIESVVNVQAQRIAANSSGDREQQNDEERFTCGKKCHFANVGSRAANMWRTMNDMVGQDARQSCESVRTIENTINVDVWNAQYHPTCSCPPHRGIPCTHQHNRNTRCANDLLHCLCAANEQYPSLPLNFGTKNWQC